MTEETAIITNEDDDDYGKEGIVIAEGGEQSQENGIVPEGFVEISMANPFASQQYKLVEKDNVEFYDLD